jgi:ribosome-associated toxin RatA of RatAB toxin-antitoxin module
VSRAKRACSGAIFALLIGSLMWPAVSAALEPLSSSVEIVGETVRIEVAGRLEASPEVAWRTLTDYEHLPSFIPGLAESRVLERKAGHVVLRQSGQADYLFLSFPVDVVLEIDEQPPHAIAAHSRSGALRLLGAQYRLEPQSLGGGLLLRWTGTLQPQFWTPLFLSAQVLGSTVQAQFRAMAEEIERRQADADAVRPAGR